MTQPKFAPIPLADEVRPGLRLGAPRPWSPHRPGEVASRPVGRRRGEGIPGPDQGYALLLVRLFEDRLALGPGEHREDVVAAGVALAMRRAAGFGRAPVAADLEVAFGCLGYLDPAAPADLVEYRRGLVSGCAEDYRRCRLLVEAVPESVLRLPPGAASEQLEAWQELLGA